MRVDNYPWDEWRANEKKKHSERMDKLAKVVNSTANSVIQSTWVAQGRTTWQNHEDREYDTTFEIVKPANFEKGPSPMATELAKQIIAWHKAGHSLYPVDVLNMMIDAQVIKEEDLKPIIEEFKKNPVEPKLPKTYIAE